MAKTKISEFSSTPGNNTDIDSINIAEGCAPSGINDAIRELMAQLKDFQTGAQGDSFNGPVGTTTAVAGAFTTLSASGITTLSGLTASTALALDASKNVVSVTNTGTGNNVLATSPTLVTPILGTPTSVTLTNATGLPISTGVSGLGTGIATALAVNVGSAGAPVINGGALGTPSSGTVTNLTGTASININGTVGATTPTTGAFTTLTTSSTVTLNGGVANGVAYLNGSKVLTSGSALTFDGTKLTVTNAGADGFVANSSGGTGFVFNASVSSAIAAFLSTSSGEAGRITLNGTSMTLGSVGAMPFTIAGTEQIRLTGTGLGIGTSSPAQKLDVAGGNIQVRTGYKVITDTVENYGAALTLNAAGSLPMYFALNGTAAMTLSTAGNLGIGTSSPQQKLEVSGSSQAGVIYERISNSYGSGGSNGSGTGLQFYGWDAGVSAVIASLREAQSYSPSYLSFQTFGGNGDAGSNTLAERMRIDGRGNLGLGVTPSAWTSGARVLQFPNAGSIGTEANGYLTSLVNARESSSNAWSYLLTGAGASKFKIDYGSFAWYTAPSGTAGNAISFSQVMTLDASGNLLVGQTSTGSGGLVNSNSAALTISSNGSCWTMNHSATSAGSLFAQFGYSGTKIGSITVATSSTVAYNTSSDYRLKNITGPITTSGAYIDSLNPVEGTWKADGSTFVGLIAHEVQEASRTTVATGVKDGEEMQGMDYSSAEMIANMIAELKSLRARVAALEAA